MIDRNVSDLYIAKQGQIRHRTIAKTSIAVDSRREKTRESMCVRFDLSRVDKPTVDERETILRSERI